MKHNAAKGKLHRSTKDKYLAGVCGGIAETYDLDPTWVRIGVAILATVSNAVGVAAYAAAWYFLPQRDEA
ncbi:hypothetical protein CAQU_01940 [Corynebacterium aquilae DSM 44791]|uniref:Phage shock protein PspC N-terminal domain-containing protein n=1 Tax=Corynebacterium aquilae DSM 44791 TaxID=1431546 RepID=A0A1L7CDW7_9CORY|nr:hypothetical protein CAQU_01940 [Corynebacterium aquilae DSM 44791]